MAPNGTIYTKPEEIEAAFSRGEKLIGLTETEHADLTGMNRKQRRAWYAQHRQRACDHR